MWLNEERCTEQKRPSEHRERCDRLHMTKEPLLRAGEVAPQEHVQQR